MTFKRFIKLHGIRATATRTSENLNRPEWRQMDHWKVILKRAGIQMTVYFSQGYGHNGAEPKCSDVLESMILDARGVDNASGFESWCREYGYQDDDGFYRNANSGPRRIYNACVRQTERLHRFLGDLYFRALLLDDNDEQEIEAEYEKRSVAAIV